MSTKATPAITWAAPADIVYGTALSATQLNATTTPTVAGTFAYTPALTELLAAGTRSLSVVFTPTDAANYNPATANVSINVTKATPAITWAAPADIVYGTALSATQLNATITPTVAGTFAYTPALTDVLTAGTQSLSVVFTPTDAANYNPATANVLINVTKATPTVTWSNPADIIYLTALGATQLNAIASVPGTFAYDPAAGVVLSTAAAQTLSVIFTPDDATNYSTAAADVRITVARATPTITWPAPAAIIWGLPLGANQLNATANTAGTFAYAPAPATMLGPGINQTLTVTFTPNDGTNYTAATKSVAISVNAMSTVSVSPTAVGLRQTVTATIANGPGNPGDWVALYAMNGTLVDWKFLNGAQVAPATGMAAASVPFTMPAAAGTYVVRLFANDSSMLIAESATVTANVTLTVSAATALPGTTVTATIANGPAMAADWVGLYPIGTSTLLDWKYLNGTRTLPATGLGNATVSFTMPMIEGSYVVPVLPEQRRRSDRDERADCRERTAQPDVHGQRHQCGARQRRHRDDRQWPRQRDRLGGAVSCQ